jgi:hypothetical protein
MPPPRHCLAAALGRGPGTVQQFFPIFNFVFKIALPLPFAARLDAIPADALSRPAPARGGEGPAFDHAGSAVRFCREYLFPLFPNASNPVNGSKQGEHVLAH